MPPPVLPGCGAWTRRLDVGPDADDDSSPDGRREEPCPHEAREGRPLVCWLLAVRGWLVTGLRGAGRLGEAARGVRFPSRAAFVDARLLPCIADGERQGRPPEREESQRQ